MKNITKSLMLLSTTVALLSGCSSKSKWNYSKEESADFTKVGLICRENDDGTLKLSIHNSKQIFKNKISTSDILFFDKAAIDESKSEHGSSYYTYDLIKKNSIEFENFTYDGSGTSFSFDFLPVGTVSCSVLIHKDAVIDGNYVYGVLNSPLSVSGQKYQTDFEEEYIASSPSWNDAKTVINIAAGIGSIIAGALSPTVNPVAITSGVFSIITNFGDIFGNNGNPSIQDVLNKLEAIDEKLDRIERQISENQRQLLDETIQTQAMIDKALITLYDQNIQAYNTDYVEKLEDQLSIYRDYVESSLKAFANEDRTVTVYYDLDKNPAELHYKSEFAFEEDDYSKYMYELSFPLTKKYLKDHQNIPGKGFGEAFNNDIKNSIEGKVYANTRNQDTTTNDIYATILDKIQFDRYTDTNMRQTILTFKNTLVNTCKRLIGASSTSVIDSYVNRLKVMYNFAGESKDILRSILVSLRYNLDRWMVQATTACNYAAINSTDLSEAYMSAIETIANYNKSNKALNDRLCYHNNQIIDGNFYRSQWKVYYTNIGNSCKFHSSFYAERVDGFDGRSLDAEEIDIQEEPIVSETDHLRIRTRYNLLRAQGVITSESYLAYLIDAKIINSTAKETHDRLKSRNWIGNDCLKFLTSFSIRDLSDSDKNFSMECVAYGNDDGDYFNIGWKGNYKSKHGGKYWSGKMAEGVFIDALNGSNLGDKRIAAYATYSESHAYWIDDEYWAFLDNPAGNYFFMLTIDNK